MQKEGFYVGNFILDRYFPVQIAMVPTMDQKYIEKVGEEIFKTFKEPKREDFDLGSDDKFIVVRDAILGYSVTINYSKLDVRKKARIALTITELISAYYSGIPMTTKDILAEVSHFIDQVYSRVSEGIITDYLGKNEDGIDVFKIK
jgi:hypothetical protein